MVDYTQKKLRSIIYRDRIELDEFDVDNEKSLDNVMLEKLESSQIIKWEGAHRYIPDIFNQVYYITTLILMEKRPLHYLEKYVRIARHTSSYYNDDLSRETAFSNYSEPVIMAMIYNYLRAIKESNNKNISRLLGGIANEYISSSITSDKHTLFCQFILDIKELKKLEVDESRFKPLCIPTEEDAKAAPANQLEEQEQKYCKLANEYVELEKEMEEIKIKFNEEVERKSKEPPYNSILSSDKKDDENVTHLQQQLKEAQKRIAELEQEVKKLKEQDEEEEEFEGIDANQKVRMEIAYRLMRKAGLNPHTIKKQRAAEFISMLLGIESNNARGNKAQTCATYLSARLNDTKKNAFAFERYKDITDDVKSRAQELGMDITQDDDPA